MPLTCNIDPNGRRVRRVTGIVELTLGVLLLLSSLWVDLPVSGWVVWVIAGVLTALGLFSIWQARVGWCAVRGMGIKTPL